jgi:hypothetical protein
MAAAYLQADWSIEKGAYTNPAVQRAYESSRRVSIQKGLVQGKLVRSLHISLNETERQRINASGAIALPSGCFALILQPMEEAAGWIYVLLLWSFSDVATCPIGRKVWVSPHHICLHDGPQRIRVGNFKPTGRQPAWPCVRTHRRDIFDGDVLDCRFERTTYESEANDACDGHCSCVLKSIAGPGGVTEFYSALFHGLAHTTGQHLLRVACNHGTHRSVVMARVLQMLTGAEVHWLKPPRRRQCSAGLTADEFLHMVQGALLAPHRGA